MKISHLNSGGLITNYYCSSKCKHCLYNCSPHWPKEYIDQSNCEKAVSVMQDLGCHSIHIGGGEPFLDFNGLLSAVGNIISAGMGIEYIETNSSWYKNHADAVDKLGQLLEAGIRTLLISISPFHNEFIPYAKVQGVIRACQETGMNIFPWVSEFIRDLESFDASKKHSLEEYREKFGEQYIGDHSNRYGITTKGRALQTYKQIYPLKSLEEILKDDSCCSRLTETSHFHIDLYKGYIPGLCSGFSISIDDLGKPLLAEKYPFLISLYTKGIRGFLELIQKDHDVHLKKEYLSKCDLCFDLRKFLVVEQDIHSEELNPKEYYK